MLNLGAKTMEVLVAYMNFLLVRLWNSKKRFGHSWVGVAYIFLRNGVTWCIHTPTSEHAMDDAGRASLTRCN